MANQPMSPSDFDALISKITQETDHFEKKLEILFKSKGFFSAEQAAYVLEAIKIQKHKVRAVKIMEPRLCSMTGDESRMILATVTSQNDKVAVLNSLKRVLRDHQSQLGKEYVLDAYPFETDKMKAFGILETVNSDVHTMLAAGGHQGYAALGGLHTQARPLDLHLYGSLAHQWSQIPGQGEIEIPPAARRSVIPSVYSGHPSYAYPAPPTEKEPYAHIDQTTYPAPYPAGAPPLGYHQGAPAPTGFPC